MNGYDEINEQIDEEWTTKTISFIDNFSYKTLKNSNQKNRTLSISSDISKNLLNDNDIVLKRVTLTGYDNKFHTPFAVKLNCPGVNDIKNCIHNGKECSFVMLPTTSPLMNLKKELIEINEFESKEFNEQYPNFNTSKPEEGIIKSNENYIIDVNHPIVQLAYDNNLDLENNEEIEISKFELPGGKESIAIPREHGETLLNNLKKNIVPKIPIMSITELGFLIDTCQNYEDFGFSGTVQNEFDNYIKNRPVLDRNKEKEEEQLRNIYFDIEIEYKLTKSNKSK